MNLLARNREYARVLTINSIMTQFTSKRERFKAFDNVFSEITLRTIFRMSQQGHFEELKSPISIGKEANVFSAIKQKEIVAVKIYRMNANFK